MAARLPEDARRAAPSGAEPGPQEAGVDGSSAGPSAAAGPARGAEPVALGQRDRGKVGAQGGGDGADGRLRAMGEPGPANVRWPGVCSQPRPRRSGPCSSSACSSRTSPPCSLWGWRTFASSEGFADVATDMLHDPDVRQIVSQQIVNSLAEQSKVSQLRVASTRPVLEQAVSAVVATNAFQGVFHAGVEELHAAVVTGHRTRLLVPVDDAGQLVKDGLQTVNPGVADSIPDGALAVAVGISQSTPVDTVMRIADICGWVALAVRCSLPSLASSPSCCGPATAGGRSRPSAGASSCSACSSSPCSTWAAGSPPAWVGTSWRAMPFGPCSGASRTC